MRKLFAATLAVVLTGCAGTPPPSRPVAAPVRPTPPPPQKTPPAAAPPAAGFLAPAIMRAPGLEAVIGADARRLAALFGPAALTVREGDAVKLQFSGTACVLDVFLYPPRPGAEPSAAWVDARRASDGQDVDRAACVAALRR